MTWLLIGILIAAGIWAALRWYTNADPALVRKGLAGFALLFLAGVVVLLVLTGRGTASLPFLAGAVMAYGRLRQGFGLLTFLQRLWGATTQSDRNTSEIETRYLAMSLNKTTGEMDGKVLHGLYKGQRLSALSQIELLEKYAELRREDAESARLLEAYLDRVIGAGWREQAGGGSSGSRSSHCGNVSPKRAAEILGVAIDASKEDILAAHKRLMKAAHPDQGGSDYLAQQINGAKDVLLKASS
ncbi:MAG: molecular chaperone DnaJ [Pseudomonadota bacterium]